MDDTISSFKSIVSKLPLIRHFISIHNRVHEIKDDSAEITRNIRDLKKLIGSRENIEELIKLVRANNCICIENYINKFMHENPRYADEKKLNRFEYQVYSQNGEDGIINEIFRRIGTSDKFFVELGVSDGLEGNTTYLLLRNWQGIWIEANPDCVGKIKKKFSTLINKNKLAIKNAFISAENIEELFKELDVPEEFDLLSVDIDGNDYWVWKAIKSYRPRAVVIEYNALFRPDLGWVMKYEPEYTWNGSCHVGASLKSLERLGLEKGYRLVGCDFIGINGFFVREDLVKNKFLEPYTSENHYEPPRYPHFQRKTGHPRDFGDFESI